MNWDKLGKVFVADGRAEWMASHAYCPTPCEMDGTIRVFAAFLDEQMIGRIGYVDLDPSDPTNILGVSAEPVLDCGSSGSFDEHGVTPSSVLRYEDDLYLFYFGWQRGTDVRYRLFAGVAVWESGSFNRCSESPILPPADGESVVRSATSVRRENGHVRCWYVAGDEWLQVGGKEIPTYNLRHTSFSEPSQGSSEPGETVLELGDDEIGFGRPFVIRDPDCYRLWYSIRRPGTYRIGYAESTDGISWTRKDDQVGIDVSESGWDSEMVCFPAVFDLDDDRYMLYNGNNYGETGFGLAKRTHD